MGKLKSGCYCCSLDALLKIRSRYAPTLGGEAAFICTVFSPGKKYAYMNVCREPGGDKNILQRWFVMAEEVSTSILPIKIFTELMPSTLIGVKCAVN